jgi:hypothetical protein
MQSMSQATVPGSTYRTSIPCEGYVHKFRLETREEEAAERFPQPQPAPPVHLRALLGKFVLFGLALIGLAAAGAHVLT